MEVLEARLIADEYLKDGALTVFSGIPYGSTNPWNYMDSKRILKLAMEELRMRQRLAKEIGADLKGSGRKAITGKICAAVWDFLPLQSASNGESFTLYPHLGLAIEINRALVSIVIPNGIKSTYRRNMIKLGHQGFTDIIGKINKGLVQVTKKDKGAAPLIIQVQRRYSSQRAEAIVDARLEFDLRTAFPGKDRSGSIGSQPQWLEATFESFANKRSNLQVAIGMSFPYGRSQSVATTSWLDRIEDTWVACKPILDAMGIDGRK